MTVLRGQEIHDFLAAREKGRGDEWLAARGLSAADSSDQATSLAQLRAGRSKQRGTAERVPTTKRTLSTELDGWLTAWLRREWPKLSIYDALAARISRRASMRLDQRLAERQREQKFAAEYAAIDAMTPEEHRDYRLRQVAALEPPPPPPFRWDPFADPATNCANMRRAEMARYRR
jgi:hypothetical protein